MVVGVQRNAFMALLFQIVLEQKYSMVDRP
jgi:hypothetical protein